MKKNLALFAAVVLWCVSCESGVGGSGGGDSYPPVVYTNAASFAPVTFKNAAKESYTLTAGESISKSSGQRGRADIIEIKPPYVTWKQQGDIYHIHFVDREKIALTFQNYANTDVLFTEKNGYMDPDVIKIKTDGTTETLDKTVMPAAWVAVPTVWVYTDKPSFGLVDEYFQPVNGDQWKIKKSKNSTASQFIIGINPPTDWK